MTVPYTFTPGNVIDANQVNANFADLDGRASGGTVQWVTTGTWQANEEFGFIVCPDGFTIDIGPRTSGWCDLGGAAAATMFTITNQAGLLIATVTFQPSTQLPVINIIVPVIVAGWILLFKAPGTVDVNLTGMSVLLAPVQ